jgi:hypothetical protein
MKQIEASQATVTTVTVEIQTVRVGKKQMTLSVFRQLIKEALLDPKTGELLGEPWGLVNYFWAPCTNGDHAVDDLLPPAEHLHVVWQKGGLLRRACVWPRRRWERVAQDESRGVVRDRRIIGELLLLDLCERVLGGEDLPPDLRGSLKSGQTPRYWEPRVAMPNGGTYRLREPTDASQLWIDLRRLADAHRRQKEDGAPRSGGCWEEGSVTNHIARLLKRCPRVTQPGGGLRLAGVTAQRLAEAEAVYRQADDEWARNYAVLAGLDQLFVAV